MEVQHNYGIKLEHLIILLALMSGSTLTLCLPLEFANKDSDCAAVSGVEILISSFCASLQAPVVSVGSRIWFVVAVKCKSLHLPLKLN